METLALTALLDRHYGIQSPVFLPVRGGTTALDFKVASPQGTYFLKVFQKELANTAFWTDRIHRYIPLLSWLRQDGALCPHLPEPVPTKDGGVCCQDDARVLLLYTFLPGSVLPGNTLKPAQVEALARVTAALHNLPTNSPPCPPTEKEDCGAPFLPELEGLLADRWHYRLSAEARFLAEPFTGLIQQKIIELTHLQAAARAGSWPLVLCHTDLHQWNMMDCAGRLVILDWEGAKRAPAESDLMFFVSQPFADAFLRIYRQARPGFTPDPDALRFFILRRKLEDIWLFTRALSLDRMTGAELEQNIRWLRACFAELGKESFSVE
ncbi:MAG: phosphotransferase [Chloroflexi bacterium]|nr:phosphotransferase [Chloroflexota bacterium]